MLGKNPIRKFESREDGKIQIHKIFFTLQGEGPYAGWPAVFIRLSGCNLACVFCDTYWDDQSDPYLSCAEIASEVRQWEQRRLVVITGGEPFRQNLSSLIELLTQDHILIQIETAGTLWQDSAYNANVRIVVSPKTPKIHPSIYISAHAFKYVIKVDETSDIDGLPISSTQIAGMPALIARPRPGAPVYLSPCDEINEEKNKKNQNEVVRLAMRYGYIAGIQLHKIWSIE